MRIRRQDVIFLFQNHPSNKFLKTVRAEGLPENASVQDYAAKRAALNYPIKSGCN
jgi:hypothetical protein